MGWLEDVIFLALAIYYFRSKSRKRPKEYRSGEYERSKQEKEKAAEAADPDDPYAVLGAVPSDTPETIRKKYHELIGKYHPDRVNHLGEEFREMAARKTTAINRAYERLKKEKGID